MFTALITTMDLYERDGVTKGGLIDSTKQKGTVKEYQKVVAVGDSVRGIKVGDLVCIDLSLYAQRKYKKNSVKSDMEELTNEIVSYNVPQIKINGQDCLYLDIRDIRYIVQDYDDKENEEQTIMTPNKSIIL